MKSNKYKNCAVIYREKDSSSKNGFKYYVCFYDSEVWANFITGNSGREVKLYKTIKGAENICKKYEYQIKYNWEDK